MDEEMGARVVGVAPTPAVATTAAEAAIIKVKLRVNLQISAITYLLPPDCASVVFT